MATRSVCRYPPRVVWTRILALSWLAACGGVTARTPASDQDGDRVPDARDECPLIPEDRDGQADGDGCPEGSSFRDRDGDGVHDDRDRCPDEPEDRDGDRDDDGCAEAPTVTAVAPTGTVCRSAADCPPNELCQSPEESSWNFCGPPQAPRCVAGQIGDSCGHCFQLCRADADCPAGMTCNSNYCISPRQCTPLRPHPQ